MVFRNFSPRACTTYNNKINSVQAKHSFIFNEKELDFLCSKAGIPGATKWRLLPGNNSIQTRDPGKSSLNHQKPRRDILHLIRCFRKKKKKKMATCGKPQPPALYPYSQRMPDFKVSLDTEKERRPPIGDSGGINKQKRSGSDKFPLLSASLTEHPGTFVSQTGLLNCCVCSAQSKHPVRQEETGFPEKQTGV